MSAAFQLTLIAANDAMNDVPAPATPTLLPVETSTALQPTAEPGIAADFNTFWICYARHEAKKDARKAWDQIHPALYPEIIVAALKWRVAWAGLGRDTEKIPLPATWLRGERWEDELPREYRNLRAPSSANANAASSPFVRGEIPESARLMIAKLKERMR